MNSRPTRRAVLATGAAAIAASVLDTRVFGAEAPSRYAGVNIGGGEFGKLPGKYGTAYSYPGRSSFDYFAAQGFNLVRVPFRWERLQPELNAELDAQEVKHLQAAINAASQARLTVVLDTHNYAKRRLASEDWKDTHVIGSGAVPTSSFSDFCGRLAAAFKDNDAVLFGLMNEPTGITAPEWLPIANSAITALRTAGARQLIFVPGVNFTGAHSWSKSGNELMANVVDPAQNFVLEVHQYLDRDASGKTGSVVDANIGSERLQAFQAWARAHKMKAFLGEFAAGRDPQSLAALDSMCTTMHDNSDVWMGWAAWAGGEWWPDSYSFNLSPAKDGTPRPQLATLSRHAKEFLQGSLTEQRAN
jgi:endoglucanase